MELKLASRFYDLVQITHWSDEEIERASTMRCDQLLMVHRATVRAQHMSDAEALDLRAGLGVLDATGPSAKDLIRGWTGEE